jgi:hypothetical protein
MVLYLCVLIVFSLHRESLKLILATNPSLRWFYHKNNRANALAQQASGYDVRQGKFEVWNRLTPCNVLAIQGDVGGLAGVGV